MNVAYSERLKDTAYIAYHLALSARYVVTRPALSPTRFIIFGRGRSGSTALVNLLHQVEGLHCDGEILRHRVPFPRLHIDVMCARTAALCYGCKVLSFHLSSVQNIPSGQQFLAGLYESGYQIMYLRRKNLFRHAISNIHARKFQFHHKVQQGNLQHHQMKVDPRDVLRWMEGSASLETYERNVLADIPHTTVTYEDDLENDIHHQATVDKICRHLGIASNTVRCEYKKITPTSSQDLLVNYEEVQTFLSSTSFAQYVS